MKPQSYQANSLILPIIIICPSTILGSPLLFPP